MSEGAAGRLQAVLDAIPYVRFLGMGAELAGDEMTAILPFKPSLVGNPMVPALHGGAVGAFMEMTALAQLSIVEPARRQPKTIDVTIEYLRPAREVTTYARADVRKLGRRIANVHVEAWQEARASPVAFLRGHFLLSLPLQAD
ncbi:MAG: PaaI family thioesterase [Caulobacteraceae bacterium]|nr:PaaI family thioesterase [Caulobacteraceae bacterium]